jgi:hypothetical protein
VPKAPCREDGWLTKQGFEIVAHRAHVAGPPLRRCCREVKVSTPVRSPKSVDAALEASRRAAIAILVARATRKPPRLRSTYARPAREAVGR